MATAGVGPKLLKVVGVADCSSLRKLGFDSLYLADTKFVSEANAAFGSRDVIRAFLTGASDAVAIAGTEAVDSGRPEPGQVQAGSHGTWSEPGHGGRNYGQVPNPDLNLTKPDRTRT